MLRDPALIPLSHQHHNGLALCVMTERSLRDDQSDENLAKLARKIVDRYELELTNHFEVEEQILFPLVRSELGESTLVSDLIADHRRLEGMVEQIRHAPASERLLEFTSLLRSHIRREENELFEEIQRRLPAETLAAAGQTIDQKTVKICL
jgi:hemerythrin-like domain-containing protein